MSRYITRLLRSRYVCFWVRRHAMLETTTLISVLTAAADAARAENRDILLPELDGDSAAAER